MAALLLGDGKFKNLISHHEDVDVDNNDRDNDKKFQVY